MRRPGDSEQRDDGMKTLRDVAAELERNRRIQKKEFLRNRIQNDKTRDKETIKTPLTRPNEFKNMPAGRPVL